MPKLRGKCQHGAVEVFHCQSESLPLIEQAGLWNAQGECNEKIY
jgi:hypothetical protein